VWFLGANSYTGGTTIHDGRLTLYNNGSITGNVVNNGQLAFQRANNLTFSGNISGTGALFQLSANTLALSGTNTYTGGTAVVNGTIRRVLTGSLPNNAPYETVNGMLILDGVGPLTVSSLIGSGGSIDLRSNALFIDQSADTTYAGALFGNGTVTKRGNGRLALSGVSTYVGSTTVEAGTLEVNGQITTSTVIVADGGTLGGAGSVATLINTAGDVTPGHGVGALTVTGSYTQAADGALTLELGGTAPGQFDQLVVTGAATLAGTLNVDSVDGFTPQPGDYFDIVVAGSVNGTFDAPPAPWVVKYGPTYARLFIPLAADFDADGDVDSDDVVEFVACRTRDKVPHDGSPACEQADFDGDGDVDLDDFGVVQRCYAGPDLLPAPGCAN
jgi:autotransporter-associated beta strand protein